jgi:hypothetical protein
VSALPPSYLITPSGEEGRDRASVFHARPYVFLVFLLSAFLLSRVDLDNSRITRARNAARSPSISPGRANRNVRIAALDVRCGWLYSGVIATLEDACRLERALLLQLEPPARR